MFRPTMFNKIDAVIHICTIFVFLSSGVRADFPTVILEQSVSRMQSDDSDDGSVTAVYPYQPFKLIVDVYVKETPDNALNSNPFTRAARFQQGRIPIVFILWADDKMTPNGIKPMQSWETWIRTIPVATRGFSINRFTDGILGDIALFAPESGKIERTDSDGNKCTYWKYRIARPFFAERFTEVVLEPAEISGIFVDVDSDGNLFGKRTQAKTEPFTFKVAEPPIDTRPKDYTGLIGEIDWNVELNPKRGKIREPLTLTITFTGTGSILTAQSPNLLLNTQIADNFNVYPPTEEIRDNSVKYTYTIRPKKSGSLVFPEISASYFNVFDEKYVTLKESAIEIEIQTDRTGGDPSVESSAHKMLRSGQEHLERSQDGIFACFTDKSGAINRKVDARRYFTYISAMLVAYCMIYVTVFAVRVYRSGSTDHDRTETISLVRERWSKVKDLFDENKPFEACVLAQNLLTNFIARISGVSPNGLTPKNIVEIVENWSLSGEKTVELERLFHSFEAARFGAQSVNESIRPTFETNEFLETLIKSVPKTANSVKSAVSQWSLLFVVLSLISGCARSPDPAAAKTFSDAIAAYEKAEENAVVKEISPDDPETVKAVEAKKKEFRNIAAMYQSLLDRGIESGSILYNQGNAWLRAGERAKAVAAYRKAERYIPTNPYLISNLKTVALSDMHQDDSILHYVYFWQRSVSYPLKFPVALFASVLAFGVAVVYPLVKTKPFLRLTLTCVIFAFIFDTSAFYDWYRFEATEHGVTITETLPRKGNSLQYETAIAEPLKSCTEFVVLDRRGDWIQIRITPGGDSGWIPRDDAVVY